MLHFEENKRQTLAPKQDRTELKSWLPCLYLWKLPWENGINNSEDQGSFAWEDPMEKEMATHSSILVWEIPWTEEPGGLQPIRLQRIGYNLATKQPEQTALKKADRCPGRIIHLFFFPQ